MKLSYLAQKSYMSILLVIRSVSDVLRAKSRFVKGG